ncbi:hypothetical protein [Timonella sp. A28]|uniref:hypothetical protein n=1 Tax=Timonella sp. A28 TaxID=3442640 RepID=UPI003EB7B5B5
MRHAAESIAFFLGGLALISRTQGTPWWSVVICHIVLAAVYYYTVRPLIHKAVEAENRQSAEIYRNNVGILGMAGILGIYTPGAFVIGGLLIIIGVVIAVRLCKYGGPVKTVGAKLLRGF